MLGTETGTYYIKEKNLLSAHLESIDELLSNPTYHDTIVNILQEYVVKSFKRDYLIYVLARVCCIQNEPTLRESAYKLLQSVCRTPTHLFMFLEFYEYLSTKVNQSTGWNAMHKRYIKNWYLDKNDMWLVYLLTKYRQRNGWTHRDVLRLTHIKPTTENISDIFRYVVKNTLSDKDTESMNYLRAYDKLIHSKIEDKEDVIKAIQEFSFVREHIPTQLQTDVDVMNELAKDMPIIALLRTLNRLTALGVFEKYPATLETVLNKLDKRYDDIHPLQYLISLKMYDKGHGDKGKLSWSPNKSIVEKLNKAFYNSFACVPKTDKRYLLALDISGSMGWTSVCGIECLQASEVACAMAMVFASQEDTCDVMGFASTFIELPISPKKSFEENMEITSRNTFGSTDISLPMTWALLKGKKYDVLIVFTDSETNCNEISPAYSLRRYRKHIENSCKLIVVALAANDFTVADPDDPGMLDICGFDASTPEVIREFVMQ